MQLNYAYDRHFFFLPEANTKRHGLSISNKYSCYKTQKNTGNKKIEKNSFKYNIYF